MYSLINLIKEQLILKEAKLKQPSPIIISCIAFLHYCLIGHLMGPQSNEMISIYLISRSLFKMAYLGTQASYSRTPSSSVSPQLSDLSVWSEQETAITSAFDDTLITLSNPLAVLKTFNGTRWHHRKNLSSRREWIPLLGRCRLNAHCREESHAGH